MYIYIYKSLLGSPGRQEQAETSKQPSGDSICEEESAQLYYSLKCCRTV